MARFPFLAALVCAPAFAQDIPRGDVCVLTVIENQAAPKKPREIVPKLDCGDKPTAAQSRLIAIVSNETTVAGSVQVVVGAGYEIEGFASWVTFSGGGITHLWTAVKTPSACCGGDKGTDEVMDEAIEPDGAGAPDEGADL